MVILSWQSGTAYDFFVSLYVLHHADEFGLRPSWAAGVRSRLPAEQRDFLEEAHRFLRVPLAWLASLPPQQRDASGMLEALAVLPPEKRLAVLHLPYDAAPDLRTALDGIAGRGSWSAADLEKVHNAYAHRHINLRSDDLSAVCSAWARPAAFGERYLEALRTYYGAFFAEEEGRIRPALQKGLDEARALAEVLPPAALIERLSRGVQLPQVDELTALELIPSYWSSPLIFYGVTGPGRAQFLYGVRSGPAGLVPGDTVPDGLVEMLKALADPTRLRILRYLASQPMTPGQLARRLRLRAPTVVHHLKELRLAGLVQVTLRAEGEKHYALRHDALSALQPMLEKFLSADTSIDEGSADIVGGKVGGN